MVVYFTSSQQMGWSELTSLFRETTVWSVFQAPGLERRLLKLLLETDEAPTVLKPRERWVLKPQQSLWECFQWGLDRIQPTNTLQFWSSWVKSVLTTLKDLATWGHGKIMTPITSEDRMGSCSPTMPYLLPPSIPNFGDCLQGPWMMPGWSSPHRSAGAWSSM